MLFQKVLIYLLIQSVFVIADTLPGLDYIKSGYDGLQILNDQLGQSKYPVFDLNSLGGDNDFQFNGKTYKVPFIVQATSVSLRKESECEGVYSSFSDFQRKYVESINFSANIGVGDLSASLKYNKQLEQLHQKMTQEGKSVSVSHSYWAQYSLTAAPAFLMPLNPMFKQSLDMLNRIKVPTSDSQQTIYNQVVSSFGSHYVSSVIMGGSAKIYTTLNTSYLKTLDFSSVKTEIHLDVNAFIFNMTYGKDTTDVKEKPSEDFTKNSDHIVVFSPEVDHLQDPKAWATWESQVPVNPQPVNTTVSYISDLAFEYPEAQLHLKKTVDFYLKNARLPTFSEISNVQAALKQSSNKLIPGVDIVGCGFDSTTLLDKRCIFQFEGDTTSWHNPNYPSVVFDVPDELFVMNKPVSESLNGTTIFSTFNDFVQNTFWSNTYDSSGFLGFGSSHKTVQYQEFYNKMYQKYQRLALTLRQITWYTLKIPTFPTPQFNGIFSQSIKMLPKTFNDQTAQFYKQFIEAFGTHVVVESDFGGLVYAEDWYEYCLVKERDEIWIKEEIQKRYDPFGFFQSDDRKQTTTTKMSIEFKENSEFHALLLGGTDSIPLDKWEEWIPTIKYNPKALNRKLLPLSYFIEDRSQKEALDQAVLAFRKESATNQQLYISQMQQISPPPKPYCRLQQTDKSSKFLSFKGKSSNILEETVQ